MNKIKRIRRSIKTRCKLKRLNSFNLIVHRTSRHIYAQIFALNNTKVLVSASTLEKSIKTQLVNTGNKKAAKMIGEIIAKRALEKGITKVSFDRSGFKYHGRVKSLAISARENGLIF